MLRLILERHRELVAAHLDELMPALLHVLEAHGAKRSRDLCVFVGAHIHIPICWCALQFLLTRNTNAAHNTLQAHWSRICPRS